MVDGPLGTMTRSLAMACAIKGAREIVIIGHTDCQVCKTSGAALLERLRSLGIERHLLPANIEEFFGLFSDERANVVRAVETARNSPLVGPNTPVQGLLVNTQTGWVDWVVNGYEPLNSSVPQIGQPGKIGAELGNGLKPLSDLQVGKIEFPSSKIGDLSTHTTESHTEKVQIPEPKSKLPARKPPVIPIPPPIGRNNPKRQK